MKRLSTITVVVFALLLSCQPVSVEPMQNEINDISKRWLPDKRVGICNFILLNGKGKEIILKGETLFPEAKTEVIQLLTNKGMTVVDSVIILPDSIHLEKCWGVISLSVANLRSQPAHSAEMVTQAIMGTPVRVLKEHGGWFLVQTPDKYIGWTNDAAIQLMNLSDMEVWRNSDRLIYTEANGTVYSDNKQTTVMSDLVSGAIVVKKSGDKNTSEVILPDGRSGFVSNQNWQNLKSWSDTVSLNPNRLIIAGKRFMGFPYLWGGTSSKGIDCSGFVKTVYFLNGVILERDASQQFKHGKEIDLTSGWNNLQKGDLLFFGSKQTLRVTHVGMYIGDSELIHSSGSVRINSLDSTRANYSKHLSNILLGAKRIIGFSPEQGFLPIRLHNWY